MVGAVFASRVVPDESENGEYHIEKVGMLKLVMCGLRLGLKARAWA